MYSRIAESTSATQLRASPAIANPRRSDDKPLADSAKPRMLVPMPANGKHQADKPTSPSTKPVIGKPSPWPGGCAPVGWAGNSLGDSNGFVPNVAPSQRE